MFRVVTHFTTHPARVIGGGAAALLLGLSVVAPGQAATPPDSFADLAAKVTPAVVNISSTHVLEQKGGGQMPFQFPEGSPFEEFFKPFMEQQRQQQPQHPRKVTSLGSGFIIDASGYIVTNNHVIDAAKDIEVTLTDGTEYPAKLIGADPKTDLALLKVEAKTALPHVSFGDSDKMRIGDWVMAVGNPFGLGGTVTAGIVSARGRDIHEGPYDDFLQIDAAINQGNSGGPAFALDGSVIGVNTAIISPSGGSVGIGFAIPANLAKPIIAELKDQGRVERGWLGVAIQELTPDLAHGLGLTDTDGALISSVQPNSPAAAAGLKAGDVVLDFAGHPIASPKDLSRIVAETASGTDVPVKIWRNRAEQSIDVKIAPMTEDVASAAAPTGAGDVAEGGEIRQLGAVLAPVNDKTRAEFDLPEDATGVVIADLAPDSALAEQGVRPGDLIERINDRDVASAADVSQALDQARKDRRDVAVLLVARDGNDRFVAVQIGQS